MRDEPTTYAQDLRVAIGRSLDWRLIRTPFNIGTESTHRTEIGQAATAFIAEHGMQVVGQCYDMCINFETRLLIARNLPLPVITIGNVDVLGTPYYSDVSPESLKREIKAGFSPHSVLNAHCWLTFPGHIIVDLTIKSSEHMRGNHKGKRLKLSQAVAITEPGQKSRYTYHPMLVGDGFLRRTLHFAGFDEIRTQYRAIGLITRNPIGD